MLNTSASTPYFYFENLPSVDYSVCVNNNWICYLSQSNKTTAAPKKEDVYELHLISVIFDRENIEKKTNECLGNLFEEFLNEPGREENDLITTFSDPEKALLYLTDKYHIVEAMDGQSYWHITLKVTSSFPDQLVTRIFKGNSCDQGSVPLFLGIVEYLNAIPKGNCKQVSTSVLPILYAAANSAPELLEDLINASLEAARDDQENVSYIQIEIEPTVEEDY